MVSHCGFVVHFCVTLVMDWNQPNCLLWLQWNDVRNQSQKGNWILHKYMAPYSLKINKRFYLFTFFRERRRERDREGKKHQCEKDTLIASCLPPIGDLACNLGMCPDWELNRWPFGLLAGAQSTESHQPEVNNKKNFFLNVYVYSF